MEPRTARHPALLIQNAMSLSAGEGVLQADGTIWSHAATLGTRTKGETFTIDRAVVEKFVQNFTAGSRTKVPVDYDHGSTDDDPEIRRARAMGKVPKAGDVLEMKGVYAAADFAGALRTAAEKLAEKSERSLEDERNYGLWIRWRPTSRALLAIQAGEYTELSICFDDDWPNNVDGRGQGPTVLAVALLNLPFLTDMLPVAASLHGGSPAAPGNGETSMTTENRRGLVLLAAIAAVSGKAVTDEEQAITELQAFEPEVRSLRSFRTDMIAAIGEPDPAKALAKVKELTGRITQLTTDAAAAKKERIDAVVKATMEKYEKGLTVPLKDMFARQLRAELEAGTELEKTETMKTIASLKDLGITTQRSGGDDGSANAAADVETKVAARVEALMHSDPEIKELAKTKSLHTAYLAAIDKAEHELKVSTASAT